MSQIDKVNFCEFGSASVEHSSVEDDDGDKYADTYSERIELAICRLRIRSLQLDHVSQSAWVEKSEHDNDWNRK